MATDFPPRMDRKLAARYLGLSVASLSQDVCSNRLRIPRIQAGRRAVYDRGALDMWMAARAVNVPANA